MKEKRPDEVPPSETAEAPEDQLVKTKPEPSQAEIQEFVRDAPPEVQMMIKGMMMTSSTSRSPHHPIFDKFTDAHVDKFLDYNEADNKRDFTFACQNRWFHFAYIVIALSLLVFLIVYLLPKNKDILNDLLKVLVGLAGGFGLGYGYKAMNIDR